RRGRPERADLHGDLRDHDGRHVRLRPLDAAQRRGARGHRRARRARAHPADARRGARDPDVLARRHPAARRLLRQALRVSGGDPRRAGHARGDRRALERDRLLLLHPHRQDHVFRRAERGVRPAARPGVRLGRRRDRHIQSGVLPAPGTAGEPGRDRGGGAVVVTTAPGLPPGYVLHAFDRVESTNDEARRLAEQGAAAGAVVVATEQLKGRGRHGRAWASPPGNLYASLLLRPEAGLAEVAQLSLVASLALAETLIALGPPAANVRVKWPNDVLVRGAKVAGLLLESAVDADQRVA